MVRITRKELNDAIDDVCLSLQQWHELQEKYNVQIPPAMKDDITTTLEANIKEVFDEFEVVD